MCVRRGREVDVEGGWGHWNVGQSPSAIQDDWRWEEQRTASLLSESQRKFFSFLSADENSLVLHVLTTVIFAP